MMKIRNLLLFSIFCPFFIFFLTIGGLAQNASFNRDLNVVAKWDFETGKKNTDDTAPSGNILDTLVVQGRVLFQNGIAKIPPGKQGVGMVAPFSSDLNFSKQKTLWMRFSVPGIPNNVNEPNDGKIILLQKGNMQIFYGIHSDRYSLGGRVIDDNYILETNPNPQLNIPVGVWVQVAMTIEINNSGKHILRYYYRIENPNDHSINWTYIGKIKCNKITRGTPLYIGNGKDFKASPSKIWIDGIKIYDQKLDLEELMNVWPIYEKFKVAKRNRPPGIIIDYSPANTKKFIGGSPDIAILKDGTYIVKADDYGPAVGISELCRIYRSKDRGKTWTQISEIEGLTWASLFVHKNNIYMMGTSAGHGKAHVIVVKSSDGGITWTEPKDKNSGLIYSDLSYHTAPVPVVKYDGRIWRAFEDQKGGGGWGENFRAFMMSAPLDADLLKASSWTRSNPLGYNKTWLNGKFGGWLEGNAVVSPTGNIVNILRVSMSKGGGKAAIISYNKNVTKSIFHPDLGFIDFPGGSSKFYIRYDKETKLYWALSNAVPEKHKSRYYSEGLMRNTLVLMTSKDLYDWKIRKTILYHPDISKHAFQYPAFTFDGNDIVFVCRTAYGDRMGGAFRQHDANYFTFHRIKNFRHYLNIEN